MMPQGWRCDLGVYPRVYGESPGSEPPRLATRGLSPRVRGIRLMRTCAGGGSRSIPACTGNPAAESVDRLHLRVYPRVYGESGSQCR